MTLESKRPRLARIHSVEASLHLHRRAEAVRAAGRTAASAKRSSIPCAPQHWWEHDQGKPGWRGIPDDHVAEPLLWLARERWARRCGLGVCATVLLAFRAVVGLWMLLANGPI